VNKTAHLMNFDLPSLYITWRSLLQPAG